MQTRAELAQYADNLLLKAREFASANHALITFPGEEGGYGYRVDGLEGFARSFLLAGFRLAGENGNDPLGLADWYAQGIAAGVDPESAERWILTTEHDQAKVEAASIALILDMTRPWIWDRLDSVTQQRVIDYFAPIIGDKNYPRNNWIWFRIVVETFLRSVGGPYSEEDIYEDLETHHSYVRKSGWYADGPARAYDHYVGWAMHLYPALWSRMQGAEELMDQARMAQYREMLGSYLSDTVHLVGGNGSPLIQGRSLIYRYAAAAPYWVGAYAGITQVPMNQLRTCAMSIISHFVDAGTGDVLTMGWHHPWRKMAQAYSGPSSPYWASKGMLGLALPADHPVWTDTETSLPVEQEDSLFAIEAPGWIVSSTRADGIVRVINHGTDCGHQGHPVADSPLYARIGYSTHTAPLLGDGAWISPTEQTVALLDEHGQATHRSGMTLHQVRIDAGVGIGVSSGQLHWLVGEQTQIGHGQGLRGETTPAGSATVISLVRDQWEIRLSQVTARDDKAAYLRIGGWPLAVPSGADLTEDKDLASIQTESLFSSVLLLSESAGATAGVLQGTDDSMLAAHSFVPWVQVTPREEAWTVTQVALSGREHANNKPSLVDVTEEKGALKIRVTWPDQAASEHLVVLG